MRNRLLDSLLALKEPQNLMILVGIFVSGILSYFGIRNNDIQQALSAILAILAALAVAQIIVHYDVMKRDKKLDVILPLLQRKSAFGNPHLRLRSELPPFTNRAHNAKDILIIGRTLAIVLRNINFFKERIKDGASIRLVMINPNNKTVCDAMEQTLETYKEGMISDIKTAQILIRRIAEATQEVNQLELRLIDFVPAQSMLKIDGALSNGQIFVEMLPFRAEPDSRPNLHFKKNENQFWFDYFNKISENIWTCASPHDFKD